MTTTVLPSSHEAVEHLEQLVDVGEVQAGRRLVEDVQRAAGVGPSQFRRPTSPAGPRPPKASGPAGRA